MRSAMVRTRGNGHSYHQHVQMWVMMFISTGVMPSVAWWRKSKFGIQLKPSLRMVLPNLRRSCRCSFWSEGGGSCGAVATGGGIEHLQGDSHYILLNPQSTWNC